MDQKTWCWATIVVVLLGVLLFGVTQSTEAQCSDSRIETFTVSPNTTTVDQGTWLEVYGRGNCGTSRITVDGESKAEHGGPEISTTIKTEEFSAGSHSICYLLRDDNGGWQAAEQRCTLMTFRAVNQPTRTTAGMPGLNEYCQSLGYNRGSFPNSNQAYSATCADGNRVHTIDMNAVCRWRYNNDLPYAGLADHQNPSTWSCNASPAYIDPQDPPRNSGNGSNNNNNNGSNSGNNTGNSNNQPQNNTNSGGNTNTGTNQGSCPSSASRVSVGSQVTVSDADPSPLPMRSGAGNSHGVISNIPVRTRLTISAGPICANNWRWWQVSYNGNTGWVGEVGPQGLYNIIPASNSNNGGSSNGSSNSNSGSSTNNGGSSRNNSCPHHVEPVYAGGQGQVTPGYGNRIRSGAGLNYQEIGIARPGVTFDVLSGPVCADGFWWWQIEYQGTTGWTVEGDNSDYWIENASYNNQNDTIYRIELSDATASINIDSDYLGDGWLKYELEATYSIQNSGYFLRTVTIFFELDPVAQAQLYCWAVADVAVYDQSGNIIAEETGLSLGLLTVSEGESQVDLAIFEHIGSSGRIDFAFLYSCAGGQTPPQSIAPNETNLRNMILPPTNEIFYVSITIPQ